MSPQFDASHWACVVMLFVEPTWQGILKSLFALKITSCRFEKSSWRHNIRVKGQHVGVEDFGLGFLPPELELEDAKAILNWNACEEAPRVMGLILEDIFAGHADIGILFLRIRPPFAVLYNTQGDKPRYGHTVVLVTFHDGERWILDMTAAQFGVRCWMRESDYRRLWQNEKDAELDQHRSMRELYEERKEADELYDYVREMVFEDYWLYLWHVEQDSSIHQLVKDAIDVYVDVCNQEQKEKALMKIKSLRETLQTTVEAVTKEFRNSF
ncbi:uncharacterized protein BDZ99DRAFT_524154 [Mytilinidion resinicola]|uniref:Uncharacterized protein n=1 Tax=Mytilinidion resinicola TaxID=574789 RepID=A0A6A6YBF3_9PEZI|nr:uncharacterized protein BDZ99DRAFT_524154 [Mytilinidion resinicola]KAF2805908.1 hypothetical protein BDZ99DRAFT_524154 [Mytilinidion resinicola]